MTRRVAGIDEAGRGPLAGPVVAAAVLLDPHTRISANLSAPLADFGIAPEGAEIENLFNGNKVWLSPRFGIELTPEDPIFLARYRHI